MNFKFIVAVFQCLIAGCGDPSSQLAGLTHTDDERVFKMYQEEFILDAAERGFSLSPTEVLVLSEKDFEEQLDVLLLEPTTLAYCLPSSGLVVIREHLLVTSPPEFAKLVVYHELGHCLLGLLHDTSKCEDGKKASVMHPSLMFLQWVFEDYEASQLYLDELFLGTDPCIIQ